MDSAASLYARNKEAMLTPAILPADVVGMGIDANRPSLSSSFRTAAAVEPPRQPEMAPPQPPAPQDDKPKVDTRDLADRATLVGMTLNDPTQRGMRVQSAAGYLGGKMMEMGSELMTGIFGSLKAPDDDLRQPPPHVAARPQALSPF